MFKRRHLSFLSGVRSYVTSISDQAVKVNAWNPLTRPHCVCPLCTNPHGYHFHTDRQTRKQARVYYRCDTCFLTYVPSEQHLKSEVEHEAYTQHENDPNDSRYLQHLLKPFAPWYQALKDRFDEPLRMLDYGCGPGPAMGALLKHYNDATTQYASYDVFFQPVVAFSDNYTPLTNINSIYFPTPPKVHHANDNIYDIMQNTQFHGVYCSEVIEHTTQPLLLIQAMYNMLAPNGIGVITTTTLDNDATFNSYSYRNDPTHICFFKDETFEYIKKTLDIRIEKAQKNIFYIYK